MGVRCERLRLAFGCSGSGRVYVYVRPGERCEGQKLLEVHHFALRLLAGIRCDLAHSADEYTDDHEDEQVSVSTVAPT